jgi:hypothetical protein
MNSSSSVHQWLVDKIIASDIYAQILYATMCNRDYRKLEMMPIIKGSVWGCSWRHTSDIIADMRSEDEYINRFGRDIHEDCNIGNRQESVVTHEIEDDLHKFGWIVLSK